MNLQEAVVAYSNNKGIALISPHTISQSGIDGFQDTLVRCEKFSERLKVEHIDLSQRQIYLFIAEDTQKCLSAEIMQCIVDAGNHDIREAMQNPKRFHDKQIFHHIFTNVMRIDALSAFLKEQS